MYLKVFKKKYGLSRSYGTGCIFKVAVFRTIILKYNHDHYFKNSKSMHAMSSRVINFRVRPKALVDGLSQWCPMAVMPVSPPASSR